MCQSCSGRKHYRVCAWRHLVAREPEVCGGQFDDLAEASAAADALFAAGHARVVVWDTQKTEPYSSFYAIAYERRLPINGYSLVAHSGPGSTWTTGGAPHEYERLLAEMEEMVKSGKYQRVVLSERLWEDGERELIAAATLDELYPTAEVTVDVAPRTRASALAS